MTEITKSAILVLSDIHACEGDPSSPSAESYVSTKSADRPGSVDPFRDLERVLTPYKDKICCVISPGDLTNKADEYGVAYVWKKLNEIKSFVGAERVIATPGNHDLDSRFNHNDFDARGNAMLLEPPMPNGDRHNYLEFWAEHFTVFESFGARFVALNSAAFHGTGKDQKQEIERGRISEPTLKMLKQRLNGASRKAVNVLVCHHHPVAHDDITDADYSAIEGGGKLIRLLAESEFGPWIVIHGHKHRPRLFYSAGDANSPVVLGAASFSAQINRDAQNKSPNQFHILEISGAGSQIGSDLAGRVRSWNWTVGEGWKPAAGAHGLPSICGFGYRNSVEKLKERVVVALRARTLFRWDELAQEIQELQYLLPGDEKKLLAALRSASVHILDEDGRPSQLSLATQK